MNKKILILPLIAILAFTIVGCAPTNSNNISSESVNIGDLLSSPNSYNGQTVSVVGEIVEVCERNG